MAEPAVSVLMAVRDGERYLAEALGSVARQTLAPHEVIVVDDGSSDASAAVAGRLGARVIRQEPAGVAAARNAGIAAASGELVAFLDSDDVWAATALERQVAALRADPSADLAIGHVREFVSPELDRDAVRRLHPRAARRGLLAGAIGVRRAAFGRFGLLSTEWRVGELMDWVMRARDAGLREAAVEEVVLYRRLHASNTSLRREDRGDHARVLKRALDRRRARAG